MAKKSQSNISKSSKSPKSSKRPPKVPKKRVKKASVKSNAAYTPVEPQLSPGAADDASVPVLSDAAATSEAQPELEEMAISSTTSDTTGTNSTESTDSLANNPPSPKSLPTDAETANTSSTPSVSGVGATGALANTAPPLPLAVRGTKRVWYMSRPRIMIGIVLLLALIGGLLLLNHTRQHPTATEAANRALIAEISQRAVLPKGEKPTITTVVDKNKAKQTFLMNADNGDKVLLYLQSGRAILYRPSTHQIVNMGPLTQPPARVFVRNGTAAADVPSSTLSSLRAQAGFTVVSQDVSTQQTYPRTLVVDLTGSRPDLAARLAQSIGGKVAKLPDGESPPDADILVIVGADAK